MQLFNDDCLKVLPTIPDKSIDLIITSPPYDNIRDYNNSSTWNFDIFKNIANELQRCLKDGGVIVWIVADATIKGSETGTSFKQALYFKEIGLNLHDTMIYYKNSFDDVVHMYHCLCLQVEHSSVRSDRTIGAENPWFSTITNSVKWY